MKNIKLAMSKEELEEKPRWEVVSFEMHPFCKEPFTQETKEFLLEILQFEGELQLHPDSMWPSARTPEHLLKSLALQILNKNGIQYIKMADFQH